MPVHISTEDEFRALVLPGPAGQGGMEGLTLEYKRQADDARRLAVRIASLANAEGGTIVVGVTDDGNVDRGRATGFYHIQLGQVNRTIADAMGWIDGNVYAPAPKHLTPDGHDIVALHVFACPWLASVPRSQNRNSGIEYPIRTIDRTAYLTSEQVEMRITSYAARSKRIQLRMIEAAFKARGLQQRDLYLHLHDPKGLWNRWNSVASGTVPNSPRSCKFITAADEYTAAILFESTAATQIFQVPYEWITFVWEEPRTDGQLQLAMKVQAVFTEEASNSGAWTLRARPT